MKIKRMHRNSLLILVIGFLLARTGTAQQTDQCQLLGTATSEVSAMLPSTAVKTGLDFNLTLSAPQINCDEYTITIATSDNLLLSTTSGSNPLSFTAIGANLYENSTSIPSTNAWNFPVPFKFKPGTTCNNEIGTFEVIVKTRCGGVEKACTLHVSINAIAVNYWKVEKTHIWGNLRGGVVLWRIRLWQPANPNLGIGDLNIHSGTITDAVTCSASSCDEYITSVSNATGVTGIGSATASWNTGTILSTTNYVDYYITTTSCDPAGTEVKNCATYQFCLGKILMIDTSLSNAKLVADPVGSCCDKLSGKACTGVKLVEIPSTTTNFIKEQVQASALNYTQGCEGQYKITISNTGNTPLTDLVMSDLFPPGITVTKIDVYAPSGVTWNAGILGGPFTGNQSFTNLTNPAGFNWTSPGPLYNEVITIRITFTITAPTGTNINNCATLDYVGSFNGYANICGITIPPDESGHIVSCAPFVVEPPKAVPGLRKCIRTNQQTYNIGDCIPFRLVVSNHGQSNLSGYTLSDFLGSPQSLEICSPISYTHGVGDYSYDPPYTNCTPANFTPVSTTKPLWVIETNVGIGSQNPTWTINGMPGECHIDQAYYLVIEFDAKVRPTTFGGYKNTATLSGPTPTLTRYAYYNIVRIGKLEIEKLVNSGPGTAFGPLGYVNPGQPFAFQLIVRNTGSVQMNAIDVTDALPSCVAFTSAIGQIVTSNGTTTVTVGAPPSLTLTPAVNLQPGEELVLTINCIRNANDLSYQCCNDPAAVVGTTADIPMTVNATSGPACVIKTLCCDLTNMNATLTNGIQNIGAQFVNLNLGITAGNLPIQEVNVSLIDYDYWYNYPDCKPQNIGNFTSRLSTSTPVIFGGLTLATPNPTTNNSLIWQLGTPVNLNGGVTIKLHLWRPWILNIPCCRGKMYYCFKVIVKDVECKVCERIICGEYSLPTKPPWRTPHMRELYERNSIEQSMQQMEMPANPEEVVGPDRNADEPATQNPGGDGKKSQPNEKKKARGKR